MRGRRELYVYYRVPEAAADLASREVAELHAALRAAYPGLVARLLRRPEASARLQTWMETYALEAGAVDGGVDAALQAEIEDQASRLLTCIEGARHVEVFLTCAS
jgi:ATP-dependent helicase YprA (DUF1998 family)